MPHLARFIQSIVIVLLSFTILLCDLPLRLAEASAGTAKESVRTAKKNASRAVGKNAAKKRPARRKAAPPPYKAALVFDRSSGKIVYASQPTRKVPPASLTKILSIYVAEDAIGARKIKRTALVSVSAKAAAARGSRMGLRSGDRVPLDDLLHGMAVSSGNDASIAVAEYIAGSEGRFVRMMNQKARALGMSASTFKNANGLPAPGQFTTARDMLILARAYLAAYPANLQKHHTHTANSYKGQTSANANPLLRNFRGADGLKTGFVSAAGYNLIATAQRGKQRLIGVILGSPSSAVRAKEASAIMETAFTRPATLTAQSSASDLRAAAPKASRTLAASSKKSAKTPKKPARAKTRTAQKKQAPTKGATKQTAGKKPGAEKVSSL